MSHGPGGGPRIAIIHAVRGAIDPIGDAFAALWPDARTDNLLEESLSTDIAEVGAETAAIQERIADLAAYVTIANWTDTKNRLEHLRFADGTEFDISALASTFEA